MVLRTGFRSMVHSMLRWMVQMSALSLCEVLISLRYWLYAAVSSKCLLLTNDEMRDHLFQLLGTSFFPRWKEKHQVRMTVSRDDGLKLHMPPPYSIVIQESEQGCWHVPTLTGDDLETPRQWICATRRKAVHSPFRRTEKSNHAVYECFPPLNFSKIAVDGDQEDHYMQEFWMQSTSI